MVDCACSDTVVDGPEFDEAVGMLHCVELERGLDFEEDRADFAVLPELAVSEAFCEPLGAGVVREALICLPRRKLIIFLPEVKALRSCAISVIFEEVEDFLMKRF